MGEVHVACWREAYAHLFTPGLLAVLDVGERGRQWARRLADPDPGTGEALVAVIGERVAGFAWTEHSRDGPSVRERELVGLYLLTAHHGTGLGRALLGAALSDDLASLWVAQDNPRARWFYARNGFAPDGARKVAPSWEDLAEVRLAR